ncbi:unnamed protein product [Paramecium octaurelia]|uniref:Protein kinase domain-containing protein n=1 Tax=Paramecium octaurelia TaxID=43137 RepID=A0A8S1W9E2_PAROT|nr:unnamed protein product [Paramecium octaurelia]
MGQACTSADIAAFTEDFRPPYPYRNEALKFSEMEVYEHTGDPQFKLVRAKLYDSYFRIRDQLEYLVKRDQDPFNIVIHKYDSDFISINMFFDFPIRLEDFVSTKLTIPEVWSMLGYVSAALAKLQQQKQHYNNINPKGIFRVYTIEQQYVYKLADPFLFHNQIMKNFYSPIMYYKTHPEHDLFKSDTFSLGLVCIYSLGFKKTEILYKQEAFDFELLDDIITRFKLPLYFDRLLRSMLEMDEYGRPDPIQLSISVSNYTKAYKLPELKTVMVVYNKQILKTAQSPDATESIIDIRTPENKVLELPKPPKVEILQGHLPYTNGCYYVGSYNAKTKKREGRGIFFSKDGNKLIQGTFLNDLPEGDDIEMWREEAQDDTTHVDLSDWEYFKGQVAQGMKQGKGELRFKNQNYFRGTFIDDAVCGSGIYFYQSHSVEGIWMNDKFMAEH